MKNIDEVKAFLSLVQYKLQHNIPINFQFYRERERAKRPEHRNQFTIHSLFPNEGRVEALRRELQTLTPANFIGTQLDTKRKNKPEFWKFGKVYDGKDVYIKYRIENPDDFGTESIYVMSFHFAERDFTPSEFPYNF